MTLPISKSLVLSFLGSFVCIFGLVACDWTPRHIVLFRLETEHEFSRAALTSQDREPRIHHPLRWVADNTWQTTVGLPAGRYLFAARSEDGRYFQGLIDYREELRRYVLQGPENQAVGRQENTGTSVLITMQAFGLPNFDAPREVFIVALGERFFMERAFLAQGRIQTRLPQGGHYQLQLFLPGSPAFEARVDYRDLTSDTTIKRVVFSEVSPKTN